MILDSNFRTFLNKIRLSDSQKEELKKGHTLLRERLNEEETLKDILVGDFLQGSYRRYTAVMPKNAQRADVDIVVVTNLSEEKYTPDKAMDLFVPFLEKYYPKKWRRQGRSWGIELSAIDFDLVITSAPSESITEILKSDSVRTNSDLSETVDWVLNPFWVSMENRINKEQTRILLEKAEQEAEWKLEPLRIPDRDAQRWDDTHPLEQIRWTSDKNKKTKRHFVNVVKAIKWWRLENYEIPKHPKGFPLERLIGECCPDNIESVAQGIVETMEAIINKYTATIKPRLPDYGVPSHDVWAKIDVEDYKTFYKQVESGALLARQAFDEMDSPKSASLWRKLLGDQFPAESYTEPKAPANPSNARFA